MVTHMINLKNRLGNLWIHGAFVLLLVVLFGGVILSGDALRAPDAPIEGMPKLADAGRHLIGQWRSDFLGEPEPSFAPTPGLLLLSGLGPRACQIGIFMFDVIFLYAAAFYLLRGKKFSRIVSAIGALAMAFSGHSFTLISAGHMGKFNMLPFAVLTFAFLDRAFDGKSFFYFALAGMCAGLGMAEQQDVMLMFGLMAAAYALFKWIRVLAADGFRKPVIGKTVGGVLLAAAVFGCVALPVFWSAGRIIEARETLAGDSPEKKWEKATDWSLPPEDILEFVAPCVFGIESGDPKGWYWGRLGRPMNWRPETGGMPNYRQHTVYLGALQVLFAIFGVLYAIKVLRRKKSAGGGSEPASVDGPQPDIVEIVFWAVAWLVCVLLALGRFGPVYGLFYHLPLASAIRAPVKFMHLVELATVILFAGGLHAFLGRWTVAKPVMELKKGKGGAAAVPAPGLARQPILPSVIGGMLALALVAGAIVSSMAAQKLAGYWELLGLAGVSQPLLQLMLSALVHGALIMAAGVAILEAGRRFAPSSLSRRWIVLLVVVIVAVDLYSVGHRYIRKDNVTMFQSSRELAVALKKGGQPFRVSFPYSEVSEPGNPLARRPARDPLSERLIKYLGYHSVDVFDMGSISSIAPDLKAFLESVHDQSRMWQLTNCRFLIGARQIEGHAGVCTELAKYSEVFPAATGFAVVADMFRRPRISMADSRNATHVVLINRMALPRAMLYYTWESLAVDEVKARLGDRTWDPVKTVLVTGSGGVHESATPGVPVEIADYRWNRAAMTVEPAEEAILLFNDRYDSSWSVTVDGQKTEMLRCNLIMRGVKLTPGRHEVVFTYTLPYAKPVAVRYACILAIFGWLLLRLLPISWKTRSSGA